MAFFCIHCKAKIDAKFKACPHCGEPISDFLRRYLGEPVDGKYKILSRVAAGGMGDVYKALHIHLNSLRVIKILRPKAAGDRLAQERFLREARLATKINHPNVATLYDFAMLDDGSYYMVWEFIEGTDLRALIAKRGALPPRYAADLAVQALRGLDAIHRAGIVHRDISPENLMITTDDRDVERVKIIDLGIAKSSVADETNTQDRVFVGKWKYCSPEHLGMLEPGERIDARADLYSFGIVFYEMLAGVPPFRAHSPHEYVVLHSSRRPPALLESTPSLEPMPALEALIFKALEKDREQRFADAGEMARGIEEVIPALPEPDDVETLTAADELTHPGRRPGDRSPAALTPSPGGRTSRVFFSTARARKRFRLALLSFVVLAALMAAAILTRSPQVPGAPPDVRNALASTAPIPSRGHVGINAYPWAEVQRIRNVNDGRVITRPGKKEPTPVSVELDPGAWEITLTNPEYSEPLTVEIVVARGSHQIVNAHFTDPRLDPLPDFGGVQ